jgi:hypothetical protein
MQLVKEKKSSSIKIFGTSRVVLPLRTLSKTLFQVAGLLKGRIKKTPLAYQRALRKE